MHDRISGSIASEKRTLNSVVFNDNLYDFYLFGGSGGWTVGRKTITDSGQAQIIDENVNVTGWSAQGNALVVDQGNSGPSTNGTPRWGKLLAALVLLTSPPGQPNTPGFTLADVSAFPYMAEIWDGQTDPPFPSWLQSSGPGTLPVPGYWRVSQDLTQPITFRPADYRLSIGLFLTPSLLAFSATKQLIVYNGSFEIDLDR